jgi:hypothetical protein
MFGTGLEPGQQVRAVKDIDGWFGISVRRGRVGIVREVESAGWLFGRHVVVEFSDGLTTRTVRVREDAVRRRMWDGGEAGWRRQRNWQWGSA